MFRNSCSILILMFMIATVAAQDVTEVWVQRFDGNLHLWDTAVGIGLDPDGNIITAGDVYRESTLIDYGAVKYNPQGDTLWTASYDGGRDLYDQATAMTVDFWGNTLITGTFQDSAFPSTRTDFGTVKFDTAGNVSWHKRWNSYECYSDAGKDICFDADGSVYVTGFSLLISTGNALMTTIKYTAGGDESWVRRYESEGVANDCAWAIAVDSSGYVYAAGESASLVSTKDFTVLRYNNDGDLTWASQINYPYGGEDIAFDVTVDDQRNAYAVGYVETSWEAYDWLTVKYNANGDTIWSRQYDGAANLYDCGVLVAIDHDGNVVTAGVSSNADWENKITVIKYTPDGDLLWVATHQGSANGSDKPQAMTFDAENNIYITGYLNFSRTDLVTLKLDADGNEKWSIIYDTPNDGGPNMSHGIALDDSGYVYIGGYVEFDDTFEDYVTIKYSQDETGVAFEPGNQPVAYHLLSAYPNPFNPMTVLSYKMQVAGNVSLTVHDITGCKVTELVNGWRGSGVHEVTFDGTGLASGLYFYRLTAGATSGSGTIPTTRVGKMVLLK